MDIKTDFAHLNSHFMNLSKWDTERKWKIVHCSKYNGYCTTLYTMFEILSHKWGAFRQQGLVVQYLKAN